MFSTSKTRKRAFHPLTMALTVVILFAMLVPVAAAAPAAQEAPEWVHGVAITYPVEYSGSPNPPSSAFVNPRRPITGIQCIDPFRIPRDYVEREGDECFRARFNLSIVGTQVDDVELRFRAIDMNTSWVVWQTGTIIATNALVTGNNPITFKPSIYPTWDPGWYRFEVCARDMETVPGVPPREWFCDTEAYAVFVDQEPPGARLIKPVNGAWLTGTELLVGKAWDPWDAEDDLLMQYGLPKLPNGGIKSAWFEYCAISNFQPGPPPTCGGQDLSWITIADGMPTPGVPYQYDAMWNTVAVPDDLSAMRFCAEDFVGLVNCGPTPTSFNVIQVNTNNHFYVNLVPGWNLVSTPLMLYDDNMATVLSHLKDPLTQASLVSQVFWRESPSALWKNWTPANTPPAQFVHGQGYWIYMRAPALLGFTGTWKNVGNQSPPEYGVVTGWNLIGYTPWGQPMTNFPDRTVFDYLQGPVAGAMQALWRYNASIGVYLPLYDSTFMVKGAGYWLAVSQGGTIRP